MDWWLWLIIAVVVVAIVVIAAMSLPDFLRYRRIRRM